MPIELINAITFPRWIDEVAIDLPGPLEVRWYGLAYIAGIILAYLYALRTVRQRDLWKPNGITRGTDVVPNKSMLEDFTFYCLLGIIIGGRIGSVLLYDLKKYIENPVDILKIWEGGMAFHGGFAGVCVAVFYASRKFKVSLWRWGDIVAIGAPIGLFLGRLANFANQELYGRPTGTSWGVIFNTDPLSVPRHPSQLYEAMLEGVAIFALLWFVSRRRGALSKPGICAGLFFLFYGLFRLFVEFYREPDPIPQIHEYFTRGMLYSIPMILIGLWVTWWAAKRAPVAPRFAADAPKDEAGKDQ